VLAVAVVVHLMRQLARRVAVVVVVAQARWLNGFVRCYFCQTLCTYLSAREVRAAQRVRLAVRADDLI
jgi:chorismate mutase